jgi:hypothetical protein
MPLRRFCPAPGTLEQRPRAKSKLRRDFPEKSRSILALRNFFPNAYKQMSTPRFITVTRPRPKKVKWMVTLPDQTERVPATSAAHVAEIITGAGHEITANRVYNLASKRDTSGSKRNAAPLPEGLLVERV